MLTVNGAYFGICDRFARAADVVLSDRLFLQFTPENAQPVSFFLTENVRFTPPNGVDVYLMKDAIALCVRAFPPVDTVLRPVRQSITDGGVVTLFFQGELHLSLQTEDGLFVAPLPPSFADCTVEYADGVFVLQSPTEAAVFDKRGERLLLQTATSHEIADGKLRLLVPLHERLGRVAERTYDLSDGCKQIGYVLKEGKRGVRSAGDELLPFAFFESVLIGADYASYLSDELQAKAGDLSAFLGEYVRVTFTDDPFTCGLVRKKGSGLFELSYFTARVENGKICDILPS